MWFRSESLLEKSLEHSVQIYLPSRKVTWLFIQISFSVWLFQDEDGTGNSSSSELGRFGQQMLFRMELVNVVSFVVSTAHFFAAVWALVGLVHVEPFEVVLQSVFSREASSAN